MVFSKSNITKAYLKMFQIKYMHMQAKKTNYQAIICLTTWDENKYNTLNYHYVVKFTSQYKDIVAQITSYATTICWWHE
jgi:hypothetical protein